MNICTHRR